MLYKSFFCMPICPLPIYAPPNFETAVTSCNRKTHISNPGRLQLYARVPEQFTANNKKL